MCVSVLPSDTPEWPKDLGDYVIEPAWLPAGSVR